MSASLLAAQHSAAFFVLGLLQGTGIKVRFGDGPMFDPINKVIWFPDYVTLLDPEKFRDLQNMLLFIYQAMALHEHEHPLFTTDDRCTGKVPFKLWMSLEDVRVDVLGQSRYPGGKLIFERGYGALIDTGRYWTPPSASSGVVNVTCAWTLYRARHLIAGQQCFSALSDVSHRALVSLVGEDEVDEAWSIVSRTRTARSSADIVKIVSQLLVWLKRQVDAQQQPSPNDASQPQKGSDDSADDSSQGSQSQAGESDDDSDEDAQGSPPQASSDEGSDDGSDTSSDGDSTATSDDPGSQPDADDGSPQKATSGEDAANDDTSASPSPAASQDDDGAQQDLGAESGQPDDAPSLDPADLQAIDDQADDLPKDVGSALADAFGSASRAAQTVGATSTYVPQASSSGPSGGLYAGDRDTRPLSIRLTRLLLAQSRDTIAYDRRGSRVDPQRVKRWHLGEREVFFDEVPAIRVDTAAMIVVDRSSSMARERIRVAREAALRLSLALADVPGTSVSAMAFPDSVAGGAYQDVRTLLPFGAPVRSYAQGFLSLDAPSMAGTPLHTALTHARYELLRQTKPRRLCVVLTDGEPDGGSAAVRPHIELMTKDRIEVIGVGIKTMAVKDLFPRHEVIQDLHELEPALFALLQSVLLSRVAA